MLAEAVTWLLTPASWHARRSGRLAESVAIMARARRCRDAWAPHLAASRAALLDAAKRADSHRVALLFGSGPLLDVPLAELSRLFQAVWLVDVVHPWPARLTARRYPNVRLIVHDVTEPGSAMPARFLDEAGIDWVASVNLISQLPESGPDGLAAMRAHLAYLARFAAPVCVLADMEQTTSGASGAGIEHRDYRPLFSGWHRVGEWRWDVAPAGELTGGLTRHHRVMRLERGQQEDEDDIGQAEAEIDADH